jgi:hypothetical protein
VQSAVAAGTTAAVYPWSNEVKIILNCLPQNIVLYLVTQLRIKVNVWPIIIRENNTIIMGRYDDDDDDDDD